MMSESPQGSGCTLSALSRGQNLFGYDPYPEDIMMDFNRAAVRSRRRHHEDLRCAELHSQPHEAA